MAKRKKSEYFRPSIYKMRFVLMLIFPLFAFGFPGDLGIYAQSCCCFVAPAFFVLSGYLVLREDGKKDERILRTIKRTAIAFGILTVTLLGAEYLVSSGAFAEKFLSKEFWLNALLFNEWDIGTGFSIWYLQSLLYAYIIIWLLNKVHLPKYDFVIASVCLVFSFITGHLTKFLGLEPFGKECLSGNFLNRALPFILIGGIIHRNIKKFSHIHTWQPLAFVFVGMGMTVSEMLIMNELGYYCNTDFFFGAGVAGVAICFLSFKKKEKKFATVVGDRIMMHGTNVMYYLYPAIYFVLANFICKNKSEFDPIFGYFGFILSLSSLVITVLFFLIRTYIGKKNKEIAHKIEKKKHGHSHSGEHSHSGKHESGEKNELSRKEE